MTTASSEVRNWTDDERKDLVFRVWNNMEREHQYAREAIDKMGWWMNACIFACLLIVPLAVTVPFVVYWMRQIRFHQRNAQAICESVQDGTAFPWKR